jgi:diacylglycerol O-acyltransferase / wax synthase
MTERVPPVDLAFLDAESASTPMHNATLEIFETPEGFDYDRLLGLIADRIAFVPRYRQRIVSVPGRLANPVWVDDDDFDLTYHVRRSALPRPGSMDQLRELTARIMSRQLDRHRPLWEMYYIEGVGKHAAILSKSHQVLVDGVATIDLGQVLLDVDPKPKLTVKVDWHPRQHPSQPALVAGAVLDSVRDPRQAFRTMAANAGSVVRAAGAVGSRVADIAGTVTNRRYVP